MNTYWENVLIWIPRISLVSFGICLALIFVGWNWSVKSAMASKERFWFRILVAIPITYPLAFPFHAKRNWKDARGPLACYAASLIVLALGGLLAEFVEKRKLAYKIESLEQSGELPSLDALTKEKELSDRNIWAHPFMSELVSAGRRDAEGEAARQSGYQWIIDERVRVNEKVESQAWSEIDSNEPVIGLDGFGLIAGMLLPSLNNAADRARKIQNYVELARVGIALERIWIGQGAYPDDLNSVFSQFPELSSKDPMTGENWRYQKLEEGGFRLYSLGSNGKDDGGFYKGEAVESFSWDDLTWQVFEDPPIFEFSLLEFNTMERYFFLNDKANLQ